ncbi:MAG TPA: Fe-S protein assembly co-chaperone HscB [Bryobacteraceae bacterium]|nr:Fe-S protein assembly co-chaperone HscB [Bryobacteraceae bacterium]
MPDYFEAFGMPRQLEIDNKDLEKKFYALSRKLHPDLFARKSAKEQADALEASAVLNDAYRVLREPIARALYVLKQEGLDIGEQGTKDVPPELLEEVFELNMALEDENATDEVLAARARFEGMRDEIDAAMKGQFAEWDRTHQRSALDAIRGQLNRRKYITNLIARTDKAHVSD